MFSSIYSGAVCGIRGQLVNVEADISDGFPSYTLVGYLASEVKEAKERVTTALKNSGYYLPAKKIIINLSPAGVRKQGTAYDLPIAIAVLGALGSIPQQDLTNIFAIGELSLNGDLAPIRGILPLVLMAKEQGIRRCLVPLRNAREAQLVEGIEVIPLPDLKAACIYFQKGAAAYEAYMEDTCAVDATGAYVAEGARDSAGAAAGGLSVDASSPSAGVVTAGGSCGVMRSGGVMAAVHDLSCIDRHTPKAPVEDFSDIIGQETLKRAILVAVSGMHHLLMIGPPGSGKSMSARRIRGIMPPMTFDEQLEVTRLYSVAGILEEDCALVRQRPFRCPHHTVPVKAMTGGGTMPVPGEISLAHRGILFLDELAEFHPATLEVLRQPLEEGVITINRLHGSFVFPADFMLVAAMNPCKCGYYPDRSRCRCSPQDVSRYLHRISRPLLDRIDLCIDVHPPKNDHYNKKKSVLSSSQMHARVMEVKAVQEQRFKNTGIRFNSEIPAAAMDQFCGLTKAMKDHMNELAGIFGLSVRGRHKLLRVARTIADLDGCESIQERQLDEASCYRMIDKTYWEF